jgi:electron transfer flavoprotein beta subunit
MRIIVCVKPVPDPKHWNRIAIDPETLTLDREGIPSTINPLDRNALEAALRLRESEGGEVVVVGMAPPDTQSVMREALAMGADQAILLSDIAFAGSDTLSTAHIISSAIRKLGSFDVVLCGDETTDGGTAQVSSQIGEFLDVPNVMHVSAIESVGDGDFKVRSQIEHGYVVIEIKPPMVLSVVKDVNKPRYVTLMNILEAEQKDLQMWSSKALDLTEPWVGLSGSPTEMMGLSTPESKTRAEMLPGDPKQQAAELADRLHRLGFF